MSSNKDEVRKKPDSYLESSVDIDYYDILVIGRTGMGKSSTVDKLMVLDSHFQPTVSQPVDTGEDTGEDTAAPEVVCDGTGEVRYKNLIARVASRDPTLHGNTGQRLKNIDFCRAIKEPHLEIDKLRNTEDCNEDPGQNVYASTRNCELLTNTDSKIRVLDTPGFFSPQIGDGTTGSNDNLAIVRHIIRIQAAEKLKFRRVLYFLPQCGPLKRSDRSMQEEIQYLVKFFGPTIFSCMVLVAIISEHISKNSKLTTEEKYPEKELVKSRQHFQDTLEREFKERKEIEHLKGLHAPPIIFLEVTNMCEEIFHKVKYASVNDSNYLLGFNSKTCCKCNIELSTNNAICEYRQPGVKPWTNETNVCSYDKSYCHPKILPVHTPQSVTRGVLKMFLFKWEFTQEQCVKCKKEPGSQGCMQVHARFPYQNETIIVEHSSVLDE